MAETLTVEQQQALALASARLRLQQQQEQDANAPDTLPDGNPRISAGVAPALRGLTPPKAPLGMLADMGLEAGGAAGGQALGALGGPFAPVTIPAGGAVGSGAGNALAQFRRMKTGEQTGFHTGELLAAIGTGAVPGGTFAKATLGQLAKQGAKSAVTNLAAKTLETKIDQGRYPTLGEAELSGLAGFGGGALSAKMSGVKPLKDEELMRDAMPAFRALRGEGAKIPPHELEREGTGFLSGLGGKASLHQQAAKDNQKVWNKMTRRLLGLSGTPHPITDADFNAVRQQAAEPYEKIAQFSAAAKKELADIHGGSMGGHDLATSLHTPEAKRALVEAAANINQLRMTRLEAKHQRKLFDKDGNADAFAAWESLQQKGEDLENAIDLAGQSVGDPKLIDRLRASRKLIAQSHAAERATEAGMVNANKLGAMMENGELLTDELGRIGDFARHFHRESVQAFRVPSPNVNNLNTNLALGMAGEGTPMSRAAAALSYLGPRPARAFLLGEGNQNRIAAHQFDRSPTIEDFAATLARAATMKAGRDADPSMVQPITLQIPEEAPMSDEEAQRRYEELLARQQQE